MPETQWEYCRLQVWGQKAYTKGDILGFGGEFQGVGYNCSIVYYSVTGESITEKLTTNTAPTDINPFSTAMGLLGASGWELVNVQHGNLVASEGQGRSSMYFDTICWDNVVAYFKRSVLLSRAVNEPKLVLQRK